MNTQPVVLAWDQRGNRFPVPKSAQYWRVTRKHIGRGRPPNVATRNGPLHIEIDATFEMLAEAVKHQPGCYVLHAVDEHTMLVPNCPAAHVEVVAEVSRTDHRETDDSTIGRLCTTVQQLAMYSMQRDEAICSALSNMTAALGDIQRSTAEILRAASSGMDIAAGASLPKVPPQLAPAQLPPPPPPPKSFMDFLTSPAGNTAVHAIGNVLTSIANGGKK